MSGTISPLFTWRSSIARSDLPPAARHIALTLSLFMSEIGSSCWPSISKQCEATGLSRATVCKHLEVLEKRGWLKREKGDKGKATHYIAIVPEVVRETDYLADEVVRQLNGGSPPVELNHVKDHDTEPSSAAPSKQERDTVWDALVEVFGQPSTTQHRARFGKTVRELLSDTSLSRAQVAAEVPLRAFTYRRRWPGIDLTLEAFAKHWPDLRGPRVAANGGLPELPDGETF